MFAAARLEKIKEIIKEKKQVNVSYLSEILSVTEVTVRRDLEKLEQQGFIIKTHGGAILNEEYDTPQGEMDKVSQITGVGFNEKKKMIGEIASHLVMDRDSIFVGPGITCCYIAQELEDKEYVNIVTNNLNVVNILSENSMIDVVLTGGNLVLRTMALSGEMVQNTLKGLFVNKAFISVSGIDLEHGYSVSTLEELNIYKTVMKISKELIIVADSSKFGNVSFVKLGPLNIAKKVITNEDIPNEYKSYFFNQGIQIFTSYEVEK